MTKLNYVTFLVLINLFSNFTMINVAVIDVMNYNYKLYVCIKAVQMFFFLCGPMTQLCALAYVSC